MAMRRGIWLGVLVVLVAAFVAACGGGGQQGGGQPAGRPEGSAVTVQEKEWTIQFASSTVKPGKVKVLTKNDGTTDQPVDIEVPSVNMKDMPTCPTTEATVAIKARTY